MSTHSGTLASPRTIREDTQGAVDAGGHLSAAACSDPGRFRNEEGSSSARPECWRVRAASSPGDARPINPAGQPLILVRRKGKAEVLSNVCLHRGTCVLMEPVRKVAVFTCPYPARSCGLDGKLRGRPYVHGGGQHDVDEDPEVRLRPVRSAMWNDLILVNTDGNVPDFDDSTAPLTKRYGGYDFDVMRHGGGFAVEMPGNRKLAAENFMDNCHIFALHPAVDASFSQEGRKPCLRDAGPPMTSSHTKDVPESNCMAVLQPNPNIPEHLRHDNTFMGLFPNVLLHVWSCTIMVMQRIPVAPDRTLERDVFYSRARSKTPRGVRALVKEAQPAPRFPRFREDAMVAVAGPEMDRAAEAGTVRRIREAACREPLN